jgi:citrate synthase
LIIVNVMGELVNARTAAERLGVDVRTLYAYVSRGALRREPGPDGRSSRYDSDELELLARRSRPRTLPRPAASIDLVIATRVSTVTDGMVRYRGADVLDLVKAEAPFERVADLLWQAAPIGSDTGWRWPDAGERPGFPLSEEIPVLHRFAIAVAAMAGAGTSNVSASDVAASDGTAVTSTPDWPSCGRRVIGSLIDVSGPHSRNRDQPDDGATAARRLWQQWSPLRPTSTRVRALDLALVLLAEHELALSTLSVRVAASARAAPASCLLAGLSTLSGSLHGGAARTVHDKLAAREPVVTGFGHPVHRHGDPRVTPLLEAVYAFATPADRELIETANREAPRPLNVDFALGALTYAARMPAEAATAIFAIARVAGWIAHAAEEYAEPPLRFRGRAVRPARTGLRSPPGGGGWVVNSCADGGGDWFP